MMQFPSNPQIGDIYNFGTLYYQWNGVVWRQYGKGSAPIHSPHFTGVPTAPTGEFGDSSTQIATNEFVQNQIEDILPYIHYQMSATTTWNINHNKNTYPSVTVIDSTETVVFGDVQYVDLNNLIVTFTAAFSGKAYII